MTAKLISINGFELSTASLSGEWNGMLLDNTIEQTVNQQLTGLIAQGLIKENGTPFESHVDYEAGKLLINGMDASAMVGGVM